MPYKPDNARVPKTEPGRGHPVGENAVLATAILKTGGSALAVIASVLAIAGQAGLGDEVTLFALGGVCFILALTLGVAAYVVSRKRD